MAETPGAPSTPTLRLQEVPVARGTRWMLRAWRAFVHRPMGFTALFAIFVVFAVLVQAIPTLGNLVVMVAVPLVALGYMIATESYARGGPVSPLQILEPLRADAKRRNTLIRLSLLYALTMGLVMLAAEWVDQGAFQQLMLLLAQPRDTGNRAQIESLLESSALEMGVWVRFGGAALCSLPFWHAPALVWWGRQGVMQSLFSSTIGLWRTKGAFLLYLGSLFAFAGGVAIVLGTVLSLLGLASMLGGFVMAFGLMVTVVFYVSLWFSFDDTYGVTAQARDAADAAGSAQAGGDPGADN
jgi:hypothetical protein